MERMLESGRVGGAWKPERKNIKPRGERLTNEEIKPAGIADRRNVKEVMTRHLEARPDAVNEHSDNPEVIGVGAQPDQATRESDAVAAEARLFPERQARAKEKAKAIEQIKAKLGTEAITIGVEELPVDREYREAREPRELEAAAERVAAERERRLEIINGASGGMKPLPVERKEEKKPERKSA